MPRPIAGAATSGGEGRRHGPAPAHRQPRQRHQRRVAPRRQTRVLPVHAVGIRPGVAVRRRRRRADAGHLAAARRRRVRGVARLARRWRWRSRCSWTATRSTAPSSGSTRRRSARRPASSTTACSCATGTRGGRPAFARLRRARGRRHARGRHEGHGRRRPVEAVRRRRGVRVHARRQERRVHRARRRPRGALVDELRPLRRAGRRQRRSRATSPPTTRPGTRARRSRPTARPWPTRRWHGPATRPTACASSCASGPTARRTRAHRGVGPLARMNWSGRPTARPSTRRPTTSGRSRCSPSTSRPATARTLVKDGHMAARHCRCPRSCFLLDHLRSPAELHSVRADGTDMKADHGGQRRTPGPGEARRARAVHLQGRQRRDRPRLGGEAGRLRRRRRNTRSRS